MKLIVFGPTGRTGLAVLDQSSKDSGTSNAKSVHAFTLVHIVIFTTKCNIKVLHPKIMQLSSASIKINVQNCEVQLKL